MENNSAALQGPPSPMEENPPFADAVRRPSSSRYVLSFMCASGNPCTLSLSTDEGRLEEFRGGFLDSLGKQTRTGSVLDDYYRNRTYIKFINGLACLAREAHVVIRHVGTNDELHLPSLNGYPHHDHEPGGISVFFCHDPATAKYKVLAASTSLKRIHLGIVDVRFAVLSLGEDVAWREIHQKGLHHLNYMKSSTACVNGVLFATGFSTSRDYEDRVIAAFDVGREFFDVVRYPDGLDRTRYSRCDVINVKGRVAVADVQDDMGSWVIRLWIKVEGFGNWMENRIQFPISPLMGNISIKSCDFSFTTNRDGAMVIGVAKMSSPRCWVFCHNMETGELTRFGMFLIKGHAIVSNFRIDEYLDAPSLLPQFRSLNLYQS